MHIVPLFLTVLAVMAIPAAVVYLVHAVLVLATKRGTFRLLRWPDYAALPVSLVFWFALESADYFVHLSAGKSLVNLLEEPLYASLGWSALLLVRSIANVVTRREPTRRDSCLSAAVLLVAVFLIFVFMPCKPE